MFVKDTTVVNCVRIRLADRDVMKAGIIYFLEFSLFCLDFVYLDITFLRKIKHLLV